VLRTYTEKQIAEHLTLIELDIYRRIEHHELLDLKWSKDRLRVMSRHLGYWIARAEQLSYWVATAILLQTTPKDRASAIVMFINVAQQLLELNNLNGLMTMLIGLDLSSISRLQVSWNQVPKKLIDTYETLKAIQNPTSAFVALRRTMDKCGKCLPPLALHLSDLTATCENTDTIGVSENEGHPIINIQKHSLIHRLITRLLGYQLRSLENIQKIDALYMFLVELPSIPPQELYQLSLEREPRGIGKETVK